MKMIQSYVREQQRYTKNQLSGMFSFRGEDELEGFLKSLKSYGVLKTVANSAEQRELTDLVDEDVRVMEETAGNDECLYVFNYVGILTAGRRVIKAFPKYILSDTAPLRQLKQVLRVLERYSHSEEQIVNLFNGDGDNRSFNILAVIFYLLNDYFENGVYSNSEEILEVNGEGNILWGRTIDEGFAVIDDGRPYHIELITRRSVDDETDYFRRLHECILTECSKQLSDAGLEELFDMESVLLSEEELDDFGDRDYILGRILGELNVQFNTRRQILLKTIYAYISQDRRLLEENQGISMFGTTSFHKVWEKACADVFGNQLNEKIGSLPMSRPPAGGYLREMRLIDLIRKPKWYGTDFEQDAKDTLRPDLITISRQDGADWFVIFDAKYYLIQMEKDRPLRGNPGVGDITKQYLYQLAYRKFIEDHGIAVVKNCFLMPTEGNDIVVKGTVKMEMLSALGLEDILIRLIPAELLFDHYLHRKKMDAADLKL